MLQFKHLKFEGENVAPPTGHSGSRFDCIYFHIPSFSSKRGHVTVKHVLTGRKHEKLGNQTFEVLAVKTNGKYDTFHIFHLLVE